MGNRVTTTDELNHLPEQTVIGNGWFVAQKRGPLWDVLRGPKLVSPQWLLMCHPTFEVIHQP